MKNIKEIIIGLLVVVTVVMGLQINKLNTDLSATKARLATPAPKLSPILSSTGQQIMADFQSGKINTLEDISKYKTGSSNPQTLKQQGASAYASYCNDWYDAYKNAIANGDGRSAQVYLTITISCVLSTADVSEN